MSWLSSGIRQAAYFALAAVVVFPLTAEAQRSFADQRLIDRVERVERQVKTLEKSLFREELGDSRNRESAAERRPSPPAGRASDMELRLFALEEELQRLTGRVETLEHRLNTIENKTATAPTTPVAQSTPATTSISADDGTTSLGIIPAEEGIPAQPVTVEDAYDSAFSLLRQSRYEEATEAFKRLIDEHPNHPLTSNAYYWLGETYYVQKNFREASVHFAKGYQAFPKGNKAPDTLLKLAMTLGQLGKEKEACTTFDKLFNEFPTLPAAIRGRATKERKRTGCD